MSFELVTWQNPHDKFLDKWQLGDINRDDILDWAMWLDTLSIKNDKPQLLTALLFDEDDDMLLIRQIKNLVHEMCENFNLPKPQYDFADSRYGIEITNPYFQKLLSMLNEEQLLFIAKLDYEHDVEKHLNALIQVVYEQAGIIDFDQQKFWHPHEVLSLGHYAPKQNFEIAYVLCNCILARTALAEYSLFDDFREFVFDDDLSPQLNEIINYHGWYAKRLQTAQHESSLYWVNKKDAQI